MLSTCSLRRSFSAYIAASSIVILFFFCYLFLGSNLGEPWKIIKDQDHLNDEAIEQPLKSEEEKKGHFDHVRPNVDSNLLSTVPVLPSVATPKTKQNLGGTPTPTSFLTVTASSTPIPDRIIVMGKTSSEDTSWVESELKDWQHAIYTVDAQNSTDLKSTTLQTLMNKGKEAFPYLTYLINNYDSLPSTVVFLHAHRNGWPAAWHNDAPNYDAVTMLQSLKTDLVEKSGYANLRCNPNPGCPEEVQPFRSPPDDEKAHEAALPDAWRIMFGNTTVPKILATPCCAQFAVSKTQIRKRARLDYQRYLDWLISTPLDDATSGRVFEYLWHIIFGQDPVYCPQTQKCYCDVYGRC